MQWALTAFYFGVIIMQYVLRSFYKQKINGKRIKVRLPSLHKCYVLGMELKRVWGKVLAPEHRYFHALDQRRAAQYGRLVSSSGHRGRIMLRPTDQQLPPWHRRGDNDRPWALTHQTSTDSAASYVIVGKPLNPSLPQFPHLVVWGI